MSTLYRYFSIVLIGLAATLFLNAALPVHAQESNTVYLPLLRSTEEEDGGRQFAAAGDVEVEYTGRDDIPPEVWPVLASIIERETTEFTEKKFFTPSAIDMFEEDWIAGIVVIPDSVGQTTLIGLPGFTVIMTRDATGWYGHTEFDPAYLDLLSRIPGGYIDGLNKPVRSASTEDTSAVEHKFPWTAGEKWTSNSVGLHDAGIRVHTNIDFFPPGNSNRNILASAKGTMFKSCDSPNDPTQVAFHIVHDDGSRSEYIHIDKSTARTDLHREVVPQGQELGKYYLNLTWNNLDCGYGSPAHLHFGLSDTSAKIQGIQFKDIRPSTTYESTNSPQKCPNDNPGDNEVIFYREANFEGDCKIHQRGYEGRDLPSGDGEDVNSIRIGDDVMVKLWDADDDDHTVYCKKDEDDDLEDDEDCGRINKVGKVKVISRDNDAPKLDSLSLDGAGDGYLLTKSADIRLLLEVDDHGGVGADRVRITAKWPEGDQRREFDDDDDWESTDWNLCNRLSGNHEVRFDVKMWDKVGNDRTETRELRIIYPDLRRDCKIDILDLIELIKVVFPFSGTPAGSGIDVNNDGKVDILDIVALIMLIFGDAAAASMADGGDAGINASGLDNASQMQGFIELGSILPSESSPNYYREIRASTVRDSKLYLLEGTRNTLNDYIHINVIDVSELANPISTPISLTKSIVSESVRALWTSDITVSGADNGDGELIQVAAPLISPFTDPPNSSHVYAQSTGNSWESWSTSNFDYDDRLVREVAEYALLSSPNGENGYYEITAWPGTSGEMTYRTDLKLRGLRIVPANPDPYIMAIEGSDRVWIAVASAFTDAGTSGEGLLGSNMVDMDVADRIADDPWSSAFVYAFADTEDGLIIATDNFANVTFVPVDGQATQVALAGQHVFLGTLEGTVSQFNIGAVADGGEPFMLARATGLGEIIDLSVEGGRLYVTTPDLVHVLGINGSTYPVHEISSTTVGNGSVSSSSSINAYYDREFVTLTAVPDEGWQFVRWEGDLSGTEAQQTFEIRQSMDVTAVFEEIVYPVDIIVIGNGSATISPQQETYREGDTVSLVATAESGWQFTHWEWFDGDDDGHTSITNQEFVLQITAPTTMLAYFEEEEQLPAENTISLGTTSVEQGQSTTVNLDIFAIGEEVNYVELYIWYDASLVKPTECVRSPESVFQNGTFICAFSNLFDDFSPILITWVASGPGFTGKETISLFFEATDRTGGTSPLTIEVIGYGLLDLSTYAVTNFPHAVVNGGIQVLGEPIDTALGSVSISGPTTGDIDTPHSFSATVYPADATGPIEYTWSPEPSAGQGTANATYTWSTAGAKQITVAAANGSSTVNAEHNIQIDEPTNTVALQDVNIIAPYIGSIMTLHSFSAQTSPFNASTPLQYSWSPEPQSGQGTELAYYAWWNVGTYQVTVTVSNQVGSVLDIHNIQIVYDPASLERVFIPYIAR